jgi:hypothetical protein
MGKTFAVEPDNREYTLLAFLGDQVEMATDSNSDVRVEF